MADRTSEAELSSMASVLDDLAKRVTALADRHSGSDDDNLAQDLYAVERSLNEARRRLTKLIV